MLFGCKQVIKNLIYLCRTHAFLKCAFFAVQETEKEGGSSFLTALILQRRHSYV